MTPPDRSDILPETDAVEREVRLDNLLLHRDDREQRLMRQRRMQLDDGHGMR